MTTVNALTMIVLPFFFYFPLQTRQVSSILFIHNVLYSANVLKIHPPLEAVNSVQAFYIIRGVMTSSELAYYNTSLNKMCTHGVVNSITMLKRGSIAITKLFNMSNPFSEFENQNSPLGDLQSIFQMSVKTLHRVAISNVSVNPHDNYCSYCNDDMSS